MLVLWTGKHCSYHISNMKIDGIYMEGHNGILKFWKVSLIWEFFLPSGKMVRFAIKRQKILFKK